MTPFNLQPNEKYGLIVIPKVQISDSLEEEIHLEPDYWIFRKPKFNLPESWKKWLGSLVTDRLEKADFFLICKEICKAPKILDEDNERLKKRIFDFYMGLLISVSALYHDDHFVLTGAHLGDEVDVRQIGDYKQPIYIPGSSYEEIDLSHLNKAARLAKILREIQQIGKYSHLIHVIRTFYLAIIDDKADSAFHQFMRCIEGLILPEQGKTKKQFISRTELFIGSKHHKLMGFLYDIRSAVEHMHDLFNYLSIQDKKEKKVIVYKSEMEAMYIARYCIINILTKKHLWEHFENEETIKSFWKLNESEREKLWKDPPLNMDIISDNFNMELLEQLTKLE